MVLGLFSTCIISFSAAIALWLSRRLYGLAINYCKARQLGLPIIICWFSWQDLIFGVVRPYLRWLARLPFDLGIWITFSDVGWCLIRAYKPHYKYGHAFVLVTPGKNEIWVDDPNALSELIMNWKKWHKPRKFYSVLEVFGRNVLTIEGADWQRQRKIINSAFTEQSHASVWHSTLKQARQMLDVAFTDAKAVSLFEVKLAVDTLTMHVLAAGVFGKDIDFEGGRQRVAAHHKKSFEDTQRWILQQLVWVIIFGNLNVPGFLRPFLPSKVTEVLQTKKEYRQYMSESVEELQREEEKAETTSNLVTTIIKSNNEAREDQLLVTGRRMYLTDEELYANLFILNMAGFETTASALWFALSYLAVFPAVQEWVAEEMDSVLTKCDQQSYDEIFPRLGRTMAIMYETLRLRGALQFSFKVNAEDQVLKLQDREIVVPGNTFVGLNVASASRDPRYWGPDSEQWRPSRWITLDPETDIERLNDPPDGAIFVPWIAGPRVCPGKKFSQVEFTGTLLMILSQYRIEVVAKLNESEQQAKDRLLRITTEVETIITPRITRPHEASVRFIRRK